MARIPWMDLIHPIPDVYENSLQTSEKESKLDYNVLSLSLTSERNASFSSGLQLMSL